MVNGGWDYVHEQYKANKGKSASEVVLFESIGRGLAWTQIQSFSSITIAIQCTKK